ncbi:MAG: hypothetical protein ACYST6_05700 [Planctomycetota bacterium]|jgi:hypothetical protein
MALFTAAQRAHLDRAQTLLAKSYVAEQASIPEDVANSLVKIAVVLGSENNEPNLRRKLKSRPIRTLLEGIQWLDDNN